MWHGAAFYRRRCGHSWLIRCVECGSFISSSLVSWMTVRSVQLFKFVYFFSVSFSNMEIAKPHHEQYKATEKLPTILLEIMWRFFFCLFTNHWPRANDRPFPRLTNILNNQISVCRICRADGLQSFAHSHEFRSSEALLNAIVLWAQQSPTLRTHIMCSAFECMDESPKMLDGYCLLFQPDYVLYIQICCCWFYETRLVSGNPALGNGPKHNTNTDWTF